MLRKGKGKDLRLTWGAGGLSEYRDIVTAGVLALIVFGWLYHVLMGWAESGVAPRTGIPERVVEARTVEDDEPIYRLRERLTLRRDPPAPAGTSGAPPPPPGPGTKEPEGPPRTVARSRAPAAPPRGREADPGLGPRRSPEAPEEAPAFHPVAFDGTTAGRALPAPRRCRLRLDAVTGLPAVADCDGGRTLGGRAQTAPLPGRLAVEFAVDGVRYMASVDGRPGLPAKCKTIRNIDYLQMALNVASGAAGGAIGAAASEAGLGTAGGAAAGALASVATEAADAIRDLRERPNEERRVCIADRGTVFELERIP
jgi:hypothetical protein